VIDPRQKHRSHVLLATAWTTDSILLELQFCNRLQSIWQIDKHNSLLHRPFHVLDHKVFHNSIPLFPQGIVLFEIIQSAVDPWSHWPRQRASIS